VKYSFETSKQSLNFQISNPDYSKENGGPKVELGFELRKQFFLAAFGWSVALSGKIMKFESPTKRFCTTPKYGLYEISIF
jgi:hypothetical protein